MTKNAPKSESADLRVSAPLVFMDTETTGLSLDDDIWEFAAIRREPDGVQNEWHFFIEHQRSKCRDLPLSFRDDHYNRYLDHKAYSRADAASAIQGIFRNGKPHVVGAVPNFDTERISRFVEIHAYGIKTLGWHYHLVDVENLAVGYIAGLRFANGVVPNKLLTPIQPPWDSDALSIAVGVDPEQFDRHTAMGDVRWAMAIYDAVTGSGDPS